MVWDPPKQEVNVTRMIIYWFIPILSIYAGWRIQKFWVLVAIELFIAFGLELSTQPFMLYPFDFLFSIALSILPSIYFVRHYARKYNEKIKELQ